MISSPDDANCIIYPYCIMTQMTYGMYAITWWHHAVHDFSSSLPPILHTLALFFNFPISLSSCYQGCPPTNHPSFPKMVQVILNVTTRQEFADAKHLEKNWHFAPLTTTGQVEMWVLTSAESEPLLDLQHCCSKHLCKHFIPLHCPSSVWSSNAFVERWLLLVGFFFFFW